jgi:hypothetical protein
MANSFIEQADALKICSLFSSSSEHRWSADLPRTLPSRLNSTEQKKSLVDQEDRFLFSNHLQSLRHEIAMILHSKPGLVLTSISVVLVIFLVSALPQAYAVQGVPVSIGPNSPVSNVSGIRETVAASVTTAYSYNWAGYAVNSTSGSVTEAQGSWIQPATTCNPSAAAQQWTVFWIGIDGLSSASQTVEQGGTYSYCPAGSSTPQYEAWYEFYPAEAITPISSIVVHAGDTIQGTVKYSSSKKTITVTVKDTTDGESYSAQNPSGFTFLRGSAECITETPSSSGAYNLLANFGSVSWGKDYTAVKNTCTATVSGKTKAMGNFGASSLDLIMCSYPSCSAVMALPSAISTDGTSFKVAFENAGP